MGMKGPSSVLLTSGLKEDDPGPTLSITHFNISGRDICAKPWSMISPFVDPNPRPDTPLIIPRRAEEEEEEEEEEEKGIEGDEEEEDGCAAVVKQQL